MPDSRFYENLGPVRLGDLAALIGAAPTGDVAGREIVGVAPLDRAGPDEIAALFDARYANDLRATKAAAVLLAEANVGLVPSGSVALITTEPRIAYANAAEALHRARPATSSGQAIDPSAELEPGVQLAPGAVIGPGARIGSGTRIGANAVIGAGVSIGRDCIIGPNASIGFALIGDRVRIYAGVVIGEAGFGVAPGRTGAVDVAQLGRVILQDGVTVGANTCIDRGAWEDTVVGENTKIDNQVQIGHGVRLGRSCVLAGQVGISGSTVAGDGVMFGAKAGISDHVTIGSGAQIMAAAGVMRDIPAGETWGGIPAVPGRQWLRQSAVLGRMAGRHGARS